MLLLRYLVLFPSVLMRSQDDVMPLKIAQDLETTSEKDEIVELLLQRYLFLV
jgi:hypothetical protein